MAYAIVINIDHENHSDKVCSELWGAIIEGMFEAGFRRDGRCFTINLPEQEAIVLARKTLENLEQVLELKHRHIYRYLRDFYGYDTACVTNLLLPPLENIEVSEPVSSD